MRILMFGWEFPPHISGGLGTACHGLTQALGKNEAEILLVVLKLNGGEQLNNGCLINARTVIVPSTLAEKAAPLFDSSDQVSKTKFDTETQEMVMTGEATNITFVKAASPITPNRQNIQEDRFVQERQWNYILLQKYSVSQVYLEVKNGTNKETTISTGISRTLDDPQLIHNWRELQTSDHFYYMCTKGEEDGSVHSYFSPYCSPYEAFINYMNVISDFSLQIKNRLSARRRSKQGRKSVLDNAL